MFISLCTDVLKPDVRDTTDVSNTDVSSVLNLENPLDGTTSNGKKVDKFVPYSGL